MKFFALLSFITLSLAYKECGSNAGPFNNQTLSCPTGTCCSVFGFCGTGPEHCGQNCIGGSCSDKPLSLNYPVSFDNYTCGNGQYCLPSQCCSKSGFCGSGDMHCGKDNCASGNCDGGFIDPLKNGNQPAQNKNDASSLVRSSFLSMMGFVTFLML